MIKVPLANIGDHLQNDNYVFIVGLGFDLRCLTVLRQVPIENTIEVIGISNVKCVSNHQKNLLEFKSLAGSKGKIIGEGATSVMQIADELLNLVKGLNDNLLLDISGFSHELLVVVLGILFNYEMLDRVILFYVGASNYSFNTDVDSVWLSRGVRSIRSVLGFPGTMLPSKKLHLVILAGFEVERGAEVILQYEPISMSLGSGHEAQSVTTSHYDKNKQFVEKLTQFIEEQDTDYNEIHRFSFSCIDPFETKKQLFEHLTQINVLGSKNIVICPLNTKISTVGAALLALEYPDIQICYAEPNEYNVDGYCEPGNEVTIVRMGK